MFLLSGAYLIEGSNGSMDQAGIYGDYSSGFDEFITRLLVLITDRSNSYWRDEMTSMSLLTGFNPYYSYKAGTYNFSTISDPNSRLQGQNNAWEKSGDTLTIKGPLSDPLVSSKIRRVDKLNHGKLNKLINFFKDMVLGYNNPISIFIKRNESSISDNPSTADKGKHLSENLIGGWTDKPHQFLISNISGDPNVITKTKSLAFEINSPSSVVSFRAQGNEKFNTRTSNHDSKKAWYVDFSNSIFETENTFAALNNKIFSFWDDKNNDSKISENEITPIKWNTTKNFFPTSKKIFSGGSTKQKNYSIKNRGTLYNSTYDIRHSFMLSEEQGYVKLEEEN